VTLKVEEFALLQNCAKKHQGKMLKLKLTKKSGELRKNVDKNLKIFSNLPIKRTGLYKKTAEVALSF
jgi:hypothetical protein